MAMAAWTMATATAEVARPMTEAASELASDLLPADAAQLRGATADQMTGGALS